MGSKLRSLTALRQLVDKYEAYREARAVLLAGLGLGVSNRDSLADFSEVHRRNDPGPLAESRVRKTGTSRA